MIIILKVNLFIIEGEKYGQMEKRYELEDKVNYLNKKEGDYYILK